MKTTVYPQTIVTDFPGAIEALKLSDEELEDSDLMFYDVDGKLFCESRDEGVAFSWGDGRWTEVTSPLRF